MTSSPETALRNRTRILPRAHPCGFRQPYNITLCLVACFQCPSISTLRTQVSLHGLLSWPTNLSQTSRALPNFLWRLCMAGSLVLYLTCDSVHLLKDFLTRVGDSERIRKHPPSDRHRLTATLTEQFGMPRIPYLKDGQTLRLRRGENSSAHPIETGRHRFFIR